MRRVEWLESGGDVGEVVTAGETAQGDVDRSAAIFVGRAVLRRHATTLRLRRQRPHALPIASVSVGRNGTSRMHTGSVHVWYRRGSRTSRTERPNAGGTALRRCPEGLTTAWSDAEVGHRVANGRVCKERHFPDARDVGPSSSDCDFPSTRSRADDLQTLSPCCGDVHYLRTRPDQDWYLLEITASSRCIAGRLGANLHARAGHRGYVSREPRDDHLDRERSVAVVDHGSTDDGGPYRLGGGSRTDCVVCSTPSGHCQMVGHVDRDRA